MFDNINFDAIVALIVGFLTSGTFAAIISNIVTKFITMRKFSPKAIADEIRANIADTVIKVAVAGEVKAGLKELLEQNGVTDEKLALLVELLKANSAITSELALVYEKSDLLSTERKTNLLQGVEALKTISGRKQKPKKPDEGITEIKLEPNAGQEEARPTRISRA